MYLLTQKKLLYNRVYYKIIRNNFKINNKIIFRNGRNGDGDYNLYNSLRRCLNLLVNLKIILLLYFQ